MSCFIIAVILRRLMDGFFNPENLAGKGPENGETLFLREGIKCKAIIYFELYSINLNINICTCICTHMHLSTSYIV